MSVSNSPSTNNLIRIHSIFIIIPYSTAFGKSQAVLPDENQCNEKEAGIRESTQMVSQRIDVGPVASEGNGVPTKRIFFCSQ